ncbi:MAG: DUF4139 domain-containing protein [Thermotogae bacterium]|nr:DUF4139 domain-containing protein [Thermotogota bacterium]
MVLFPVLADSIIFYSDLAEVHYTLPVKRKVDEVVIRGIPKGARDLEVWSSSGYVIGRAMRDTVLPADRRKYDSLKTELARIRRRISQIQAAQERLKYESDLLLSYVKKDGKESVKQLLSLSPVIERNRVAMDSLREMLDSLKAVSSSIQKRLSRLNVSQSTLTVRLEGFKGGKIFLRYRIPGRWDARYRLQADPTGGKLHLEGLAELRNPTPIPLEARRVILTTAYAPFHGIPKHRRWTIGVAVPKPMEAYESKRGVALKLGGPSYPSVEPPVRRRMTYVSTRYEYDGRLRIPAKGDGTSLIPLFRKSLSARYERFIYPEISPKAYFQAIFKPDEDLLAGHMDVYMGGELVASFKYDGGQRGVEDTVFAGYDPLIVGDVKLVRQEKKDRKKNKRLFTIETRVERITVRNGRDVPLSLTLYARKPFAGSQVRILSVSFKPKPKRDLGEGLMMWKVSLKPGESFSVERTVKVEYPKGISIWW